MLALVSFSVGNYFFMTDIDPYSDFSVSLISHKGFLFYLFSSVDKAALKKRQHGSNQATHRCVVLPIYIVHTR